MQMKIKLNFDEDSGDSVFNYNEMGIVNIDININLDDNLEEEDPVSDFWLGILNLKNAKNLEKVK